MMRRTLPVALVLLLTSCGLGGSQPELRVALIGDQLATVDADRGRLPYPAQALAMATMQGLVGFDAQGQIEPAVAQSWIVTDDGLSYIFRLRDAQWADGTAVTTRDITQLLLAHTQSDAHRYRYELSDIASIKAMTKRVIEIRLKQPMPYLLDLLAQPELGFARRGKGSGPMASKREEAALILTPMVDAAPDEDGRTLRIEALPADKAIAAFAERKIDVVLGGRFQDYPLIGNSRLERRSEIIDPAEGLFGIAVRNPRGALGRPAARRALALAIDREALTAALGANRWEPRSILNSKAAEDAGYTAESGDLGKPLTERRTLAVTQFIRTGEPAPEGTSLSIWLPEGPGADILLDRLRTDWGVLGVRLTRAGKADQADLVLLDEIAPTRDPFWLLRRLSCDQLPVCDKEADAMVAAAPGGDSHSRSDLYRQATGRLRDTAGFIPLATPLRWALGSPRTPGLNPNIRARHPLNRLGQRAN